MIPESVRRTEPSHGVPIPKSPPGEISNIRWQAFFPYTLEQGISVLHCPFEEIEEWNRGHLAQIYSQSVQDSPFPLYSESDQRRNFYCHVADCFSFKDGPTMIGMFTGNCVDWGTFYLRSALILEEYRGRSLYRKFLDRLTQALTHAGISRIEVDVVPTHFGSIHLYTKLGFFITGISNTERWGSLIRFTRFLDKTNEAVFLRQFCSSRG